VDDADGRRARFATLPRMSIEMQAAEVYRLANTLRSAAGDAEQISACLRETPQVGGGLQTAVQHFLESHRAAGKVFAGELAWLGDTVTDVADSWLHLDGTLLSPRGPVGAE
jgi:hypothetical protein